MPENENKFEVYQMPYGTLGLHKIGAPYPVPGCLPIGGAPTLEGAVNLILRCSEEAPGALSN